MTTASSDLAAMAPVVLNHSKETSNAHYDVFSRGPRIALAKKKFFSKRLKSKREKKNKKKN